MAALSEKAAKAKREYQRRWRAKNKAHIEEYNERYWSARAEAAAEAAKKESPHS